MCLAREHLPSKNRSAAQLDGDPVPNESKGLLQEGEHVVPKFSTIVV